MSFFKPLIQPRTYLETFDLLLDLAIGILWFTVFTTFVATGASLLITLVGLPILTATFYLARAVAHAERARVRAFLGARIDTQGPFGVSQWSVARPNTQIVSGRLLLAGKPVRGAAMQVDRYSVLNRTDARGRFSYRLDITNFIASADPGKLSNLATR